MKPLLAACLSMLFAGLFIQSTCLASIPNEFSEEQIRSGKLYLKSDNQMLEIDQLLTRAKSEGKLAIIAMGANWCHDSLSFAKKMYHPEVKPMIDNGFELLFVDVGYLTNVKEVITRFGQPIIYATPTVLVIDPISNIQINQNNMHLWRDSAKLSVDETKQNFANIVANKQSLLAELAAMRADNTGELAKLNQQIDEFQQQQAQRLYRAFEVIGPMLEKDEQGESVKNFRKYWKAVAKYRYKFTGDLKKLRADAVKIAQTGNIKQLLEFPEYKPFEWEK